MVTEIHSTGASNQLYRLPENASCQGHAPHPAVGIDNRIPDDTVLDAAAGSDRYVGTNDRVSYHSSGSDGYRLDHHRILHRTGASDRIVDQQITVGLQQGFRFAAIEPGADFRCVKLNPVLNHPHEYRGQIKLPLDRIAGGDGLL